MCPCRRRRLNSPRHAWQLLEQGLPRIAIALPARRPAAHLRLDHQTTSALGVDELSATPCPRAHRTFFLSSCFSCLSYFISLFLAEPSPLRQPSITVLLADSPSDPTTLSRCENSAPQFRPISSAVRKRPASICSHLESSPSTSHPQPNVHHLKLRSVLGKTCAPGEHQRSVHLLIRAFHWRGCTRLPASFISAHFRMALNSGTTTR